MQVGVLVALQLRVQVSMRSVLSPSIGSDVLVVSLDGIVCIEVLEIVGLRVSKLRSCLDESVFGTSADVSALADVDVAVMAVSVFVSLAMVFLELMRGQCQSSDFYLHYFTLFKKGSNSFALQPGIFLLVLPSATFGTIQRKAVGDYQESKSLLCPRV